MFKGLKELNLCRNNKARIVIALELVLLILFFIGIWDGGEDLPIESRPNTVGEWSFHEDEGEWHIEGQAGEITFTNISLSSGVYRICLEYITDTDDVNICTAEDGTVSYNGLLTNGASLFSGKTGTDYMVWLKEDTDHFSVKVSFMGAGSLTVKGLTIEGTNILARIRLFWAIVGICCFNGIAVALMLERKRGISLERRNVALMLGVAVLMASLPLMTNYVIGGGDIVFHMMRIEGVKDGLVSGQFPVRIPPEWLFGHGYASSIFYGDLFLIIPAAFRLIGMTVQDSYKLFIFLLNLATVLVSYGCFRRMLQNRYLGAFCSTLYTLSVYRIYVCYCRAAVGETAALVFLPLLAYGFYRVYTEDCTDEKYASAWVPLTAGYCGLICSHILSCELMGGFSVLLCLVMWKKTFRKRTFLLLFKAVFLAVIINLWFLVPFGDYMFCGDYVLHHTSARTIQNRGLYPAHLLFTFFRRGGNSMFGDMGMVETEPIGVGISLFIALAGFLVYVWTNKGSEKTVKSRKTGAVAAGIAVVAMVFSLQVFPWDRLQGMNRIFGMLISNIQFPSRFLGAATVALTMVAGILGKLIWQEKGRLWRIGFGCTCMGLIAVSGLYLINDILVSSGYFKLYNEESIGAGYIAGAEYLPSDTDMSLLAYNAPENSENVLIDEWEKEYLCVTMKCSNPSEEEGYVDLPMLYYKGYVAYADDKRLKVCAGNNHLVRCILPSGYDGIVKVKFSSPWYWRLSELVSAAAICGLFGNGLYRKKRSKRCMQ